MGYQVPNIEKEIYLPLDTDFIYEHDHTTFKNFAELYKKEYGIDLHDLFELKQNDDNEFYVILKTPYKLFTYSISDAYGEVKNLVALGVHKVTSSPVPSGSTVELIVIGCGIANDMGYGFQICLGTTVPTSIDDLLIEMKEY